MLELEAMRSIIFEARLSTKLEVHFAPYKAFLNIEDAGGQRSEQKKSLILAIYYIKYKMSSEWPQCICIGFMDIINIFKYNKGFIGH